MSCRIDIAGRKVWNDNNNAYNTRPPSVVITLLRDGEEKGTRTVSSTGSGRYRFHCLPVWKDSANKYKYEVKEVTVPGYTTRFDGNNIVNTLTEFTITGTKVWADNHNAAGQRPTTVTVNLLQNGAPFKTETVNSPATGDTAPFSFTAVPFADAQGKPYVYTITENPVANYKTTINGFNITNTFNTPTPN